MEAKTLFKLIILYMLNRVDFPLSKSQIADFLLIKGYTDFITFQTTISELKESGMINSSPLGKRLLLSITEDGKQTLLFFGDRIYDVIKSDIDAYLKENSMELRNELSVSSDYSKHTNGDFLARLRADEKGSPLVDITLSVPDEEIAQSICENWLKRNQEIYQYLLKNLF